MKQTAFQIKVFVLLILFILPCNAIAAEKAWLGVQVQNMAMPGADGVTGGRRSRAASISGLIVVAVTKDSPAEKMGLRKGDVILYADEHKLTDPAVLANFIAELQPGYEIALTVLRNGQTSIFLGKLALLPQQGKKAVARVPLTKISDDTEIIIQMGHTSGVSRVIFSSSGNFLLSGDSSKTVKLWDTETGKEIRSYSDFDDRVNTIALTADEKYIFAGGSQGWLKILDFESGKGIWSLKGHADAITSAIFSSDGKYIVTGSSDKTIKLWGTETGKEIKTLTGSPEAIARVKFSPDEKYILSGGKDGVLRLWDVSSGNEINTFRSNAGWISAIAFSPDGKYVFSGNEKTLIKVWEIATGKEVKSFSIRPDDVSRVAFSPDARHVLSVGIDRVFHLWDIFSAKEILSFTGHSILIFDTSFSRDGKYIVSGSEDRTIKIWEAATGMQLKSLAGKASWIYTANFSPDGTQALSTSEDRAVKLWDTALGKQTAAFRFRWDIDSASEKEPHEFLKSKLKTALFSRNGKQVLSRAEGEKGVIIIWNAASGKVEKFFIDKKFLLGSGAAQFSPDEKYIISGGEDKIVKIWDVAAGKEFKRFVGHESEIDSVSFSPDGKYALSAGGKAWDNKDSTIRLWDIATGKEIRKFVGHTSKVFSVAFSPDGKYAASGSVDKTVRLWDIAAGRELKTLTGHTGSVSSVSFSHNGKFILSGCGDNLIKLWDAATGKEIKTFTGHVGWVNSVSFSPDDKKIISGSFDATTRLWDIATGKELARFIGFNDGEWIVITPEGYYNSSQNGHKHSSIRMGNSIYGIDQFYDVFYRPDIVAAKLRGDDISSLITLTIDDAIKNPPPTVEFASVPSGTDESKVKVCYQVKSTGGGIGEVRLFHNGKLIESDGYYKDVAKTSEKMQLASLNSKTIYEDMRSVKIKGIGEISPIKSKVKGEQFEDCKQVDAIQGENEISLSAFNSSNTVQSYMQTAKFNSTIKAEEPHLYILSIGIDQYKDKSVNLKYALKDAKDIKEKLLSQSVTLYKSQNILHELLIDKDAAKTNILNKITAISQKIKPSDSFILFVAGHGILLQNQYYMLTSEYDGNINEDTMISSNEIVEMSKKIKSLSQLFIFDTCHAGGVDYIVSGLYDARMSVLAKKMGLHIYASANDKQAAMDGYQGNGLFTYTLLDGLNNNRTADKNADNKITLVELGEYTKITTTDVSKKIGHSQTPLIINFGKDNPVYNLR